MPAIQTSRCQIRPVATTGNRRIRTEKLIKMQVHGGKHHFVLTVLSSPGRFLKNMDYFFQRQPKIGIQLFFNGN
jgi:hypothetical protein